MGAASDRSLIQFQRDFSRAIRTEGPQDPDPRLEIYRSAHRNRVRESLEEDFPILARVLGSFSSSGSGNFRDLVNEFIALEGSRYADLGELGKSFAPFVKSRFERFALPFLPDLVSYEWLKALSLLAPEAELPAGAHALPSELDIPIPSPSVRIWVGRWPVHLLDHRAKSPVIDPRRLDEREVRLVIWAAPESRGRGMSERELSMRELTMLRLVLEKKPISELSEQGAHLGFDPSSFQELFRSWMLDGIIVGWTTP